MTSLFYFIFKLYNIVLVLLNIEMNPPQVYLCSPSWTLLPNLLAQQRYKKNKELYVTFNSFSDILPFFLYIQVCCLVAKSCLILLRPHGLSLVFRRQEYWSGLPFPCLGDFLTQEWNLRLLPHLLHCKQVLYWWATFSNLLLSEKLPFFHIPYRVDFLAMNSLKFCLTVFLFHFGGISSLDIELWLGRMSCLLFRVFRFSVYFVINKNIIKVKCQKNGYWYDKASFTWINVLKQGDVLGVF